MPLHNSPMSVAEVTEVIEQVEADVVVAGGGVSALLAAYHAHQSGAHVIVLGGSGGASARISSLNAALTYDADDTDSLLFSNMLEAGALLNETRLLRALTRRIGPEVLRLAQLGVNFEMNGERLARRRAAGSWSPWAVYSSGMIGVDIMNNMRRRLSAAAGVQLIPGARLVQLDVDGGQVHGGLAFASRERRWVHVRAGALVLATGGAGQLFKSTTNPRGSIGTGYALALDAGCGLIDMEMVSFEPFITIPAPGQKPRDLPTTVMYEGARLLNGRGDEFLDMTGSPSKDIICRAMVDEIRCGRGTAHGGLYYDLRAMDARTLARYPQITQALRAHGLRPGEDMLEVAPAQHYLMGGVRTDSDTSTGVAGLFAVGELAGGAHGAHRLAGAGGTEAVAGGAIAGEAAAAYTATLARRAARPRLEPQPHLLAPHGGHARNTKLRTLRDITTRACGILRNGDDLTNASQQIHDIWESSRHDPREAYVARAALISLAIADCALARQESRGDHFRTDYPSRDDGAWKGNLTMHTGERVQPIITFIPIVQSDSGQIRRSPA